MFEQEIWMSREAIEDKSSGHFLVRSSSLPAGWQPVGPEEAGRVWGKEAAGRTNPRKTPGLMIRMQSLVP